MRSVRRTVVLDLENDEALEENRPSGQSFSAYLRLILERARRANLHKVLDDRANGMPIAILAVVLIAAVAVAIVFLGMGLNVGPGPRCEIHGTTMPGAVLLELRKHDTVNGALVVTVVSSLTSSSVDGSYRGLATACGGFFSVMASKPGYFPSQRESLPFNGDSTSIEINWSLNEDPSQSPPG